MKQFVLSQDAAISHEQLRRITGRLSAFDPISLSEMDGVALLNRTDTKFLLTFDDLVAILPHLETTYRVLQIEQKRLSPYRNLYFDTATLSLYQQHHNGMAGRHKVRMREYVDSHLSFIEVKLKTNKKRTIKNRLQTEAVTTSIDGDESSFLSAHYPDDTDKLGPILWNNFTRITLVSRQAKERLTFDIDLTYSRNEQRINLAGLVIAEVKQEKASASSAFIQRTRALGIRPKKFSKYCVGVSLLFRNVKANKFKPTLLFANKLMQRNHHAFS